MCSENHVHLIFVPRSVVNNEITFIQIKLLHTFLFVFLACEFVKIGLADEAGQCLKDVGFEKLIFLSDTTQLLRLKRVS